MADPLSLFEDKLEYAFLSLLSDAGLEEYGELSAGIDFRVGENEKAIVVTVENAEEAVLNSLNYQATVRIACYAPGDVESEEETKDSPKEVLSDMAQRVRNAVLITDLAAQLTALEKDFTVDLVTPAGLDHGFDGRHFFRSISFQVMGAPADF